MEPRASMNVNVEKSEKVGRLSGGSVSCDLWHRRRVASLSAFFKIDSLVDHPVRGLFPAQYVLRRPTRGALAAHCRSFEMPRSRTVQFSRSFVLSCVRLWTELGTKYFFLYLNTKYKLKMYLNTKYFL